MKAVLIDGQSLPDGYEIEKQIFAENGIDFIVEECESEEQILQACQSADIVLCIYKKIPASVILQLNQCKVMVRYGIGYDAIDIQAASEMNIPVCNIPDYCIPEVATHTMALILALARKVNLFDRSIRQGVWNDGYGYPSHRLSKQTLGLLGFGNISREVTRFAKAFGFQILAYDPFVSDTVFEEYSVTKVDLNTCLAQSDILSLHLPLNEQTYHLINKETISKMKPGAFLVNTSRGALINLDDLTVALQNGRLGGAALDVLEREPISLQDEILTFENVILTPHASYKSVESSAVLHHRVAETACAVIKGDRVYNVVNKEIYS